MGLGLNSMEGREAKHISIAKYAANTIHACRWEQVFHHEYISLIWLTVILIASKIAFPMPVEFRTSQNESRMTSLTFVIVV